MICIMPLLILRNTVWLLNMFCVCLLAITFNFSATPLIKTKAPILDQYIQGVSSGLS